jgi:hypothetical protein
MRFIKIIKQDKKKQPYKFEEVDKINFKDKTILSVLEVEKDKYLISMKNES